MCIFAELSDSIIFLGVTPLLNLEIRSGKDKD